MPMRSHDALTQLAAAVPRTEPPLAPGEEDRIFERILASPRVTVASRPRPRRLTVALSVLAVLLAAVASIELVQGSGSTAKRGDGLTGATISLAGYRFRTPAGFQESSSSCGPSATERFSAAASAQGGCVEAFFLISTKGSAVPAGATPVDVGAYQGYLAAAAPPQPMTLYVVLPPLQGEFNWQAVLLQSQGLTSDQLVAVAKSGLPATPSGTVG